VVLVFEGPYPYVVFPRFQIEIPLFWDWGHTSGTAADGPACGVGFIPKENTTCWCAVLLAPNSTRSQCNCGDYGVCDLKPGVCIDAVQEFTPEQRLEVLTILFWPRS